MTATTHAAGTGGTAVSSVDAEAAARAGSLLRAVRNTAITVLYQNLETRYVWAENLPADWLDRPIAGLVDNDIFTPSVAQRLTAAKDEAVSANRAGRLEIEFATARGSRWYDVWIDADRDGSGHPLGLVTTAVDITEQKRREQTLRTLLREVSHRSKNLLAIIQSIAAQTGRYTGTVAEFLKLFRGRLQSLASSQDLVTSSNWRGALMSRLVRDQVGPYCADAERNIAFDGSDIYLTPNAALHVGLGLHELAVNSVTHGSLATPDGRVEIAVAPFDLPEWPAALLLTWTEPVTGAGVVTERKFGGVALERVVPASLNSTASLGVAEGRLRYRLVLPADSFHPADPSSQHPA